MKRNPASPWNPAESVELEPREYEEQVASWLRKTDPPLQELEVRHLEKIEGSGGEYEFDAVARFMAFQGAELVILVECKRWKRPVDRDVLLSLEAKLQDVGAHKAMVFSTSGFQSGALEYAASKGIATITFIDGNWTYETKAAGSKADPPPWIELPRFAGQRLTKRGKSISTHLIDDDQVDALNDWFRELGPFE